MKSMNKKLLMSLSVLATPFAVESVIDNTAHANGQYTLNADTKTYKTASSAVAGKSASSTYTKGNYYVYKQANGMINISKTPGKPGAWINPNTNQTVAAPTKPVQTAVKATPARPAATTQTTSQASSSIYTINSPTKVYATAANASKKVGATATYQSGTYHIYKNYNGMLNISKSQGKAGAWINPAEVKTTVAKPITQEVRPATQATSKTQQKPVANTVTKPGTSSNQYSLNKEVKVYASAANAKQGIGSKTTYKAGNYFIFRRSGDMINISRVAGRAGAWINPSDNSAPQVVVTPVTPTQTTKTSINTKPATQTTKPQATSNLAAGNRFELANEIATYSNAASAKQGTGSTSKYGKGTYYIYKNYNGMLNISKTPGKAGAWINPNVTSSVVAKGNSNLVDSPIAPVSKNPITSTKYTTANKIYSVMTEFGLNKYQVAGILGNFEAESNINPEIFEAYFRPTAKSNAKQLADISGPTVENLFEGGWEQFKSDYAARGIELTEKGYDYTGSGVHWLGVGLGQWTGPASKGLWEFSKSRGMSMWSVDTQLAYMLSQLPGDVSLYNRLVTFRDMPATSAVQGADNFANEWEKNVKNLAAQKRRNEADKWLAELNKMEVDRNYARTIMSKVIK